MKRAISAVSALAVAAVLPLTASTAQAKPASSPAVGDHSKKAAREDNRTSPLATKRTSQRKEAVNQLLSGDAKLKGRGAGRRIQMADGDLVDYPASQSADLLTFLVDFGDNATGIKNPDFPTSGPQHNAIPEPGADDNSTYWKSDFNRKHYEDMFFNGMPEQGGESFKGIYNEMSSGRFDLEGDVSDWVTVDHPESYYSTASGDEDQTAMTNFIGDTANAWYDAQAAGGKSDADIKAYLAQFDKWDRYDIDGDGNYNEPDGYIDHFQAVHAGEGEEAGAAPWTIWSHRWSANIAGFGTAGPAEGSCEACYPVGGVEIGDTGYFIYDYTTEPENGGLGVFAHEFGHDLGLPDYYDTGDGDNSNGYWTLMDSGSWLGHGQDSIGTGAGHMGPTEKLFLGWYGQETSNGFDDLAVVDGLADEPKDVVLGPSYHATKIGKQAVLVNVPDGQATADGPIAGDYLYSGTRDATAVQSTSPSIAVPAEGGVLTANVRYNIETDYDYAYLEVSDDNGATWTKVSTSRSQTTNPNGANLGNGITGTSGSGGATAVDLTADLGAYAGKSVKVRWEYITDANTHGFGLIVDNLSLGAYSTTFADASDWTNTGFVSVVAGKYEYSYSQYYMAENRSFAGYDKTLAEGPYSFDYAVTAPNKVDHYSYEDGLLLWYSNSAYGDNNTSEHPGYGANLPVDSHPGILSWKGTGTDKEANGRLQSFDATFDVDDNSAVSLTREVVGGGQQSVSVPARPAIPVFEDGSTDAYYDASGTGWFSTRTAGSGAMIQVVSSDESTGKMVIKVGKRFVAQTAPAKLSGTGVVGKTLTVTPPTWYQDGVTTTVTWKRDGKAIAGAGTGASYRVRGADAGHRISATVVGSKAGYRSASVTTSAVTVSKMKPVVKIATGKAKAGKKVRATVRISASDTRATGAVKVTYAGKSRTVHLKNGKVTVTLPAKKKGTYTLKITYRGDTGFAGAAKVIKVKVKK